MKIQVDLHTHTVNSGHAYSTIEEMARSAKAKGIRLMAMTDHAPEMPQGAHKYFFVNQKSLPEKIHGVRILRGCEGDIINEQGELDLEPKILESLECVIASMHIDCTPLGLTKEQNTQMYIRAIQNPNVDILGHIENPRYEIDIPKVMAAAKEANKLVELNAASFLGYARSGSKPYLKEIVKTFIELDMLTVLNSDAHGFNRVADVQVALDFALELGLNPDNILSFSAERTAEHLGISL